MAMTRKSEKDVAIVRDAALLRALKTPPTPHKPIGKKKRKAARKPGKKSG